MKLKKVVAIGIIVVIVSVLTIAILIHMERQPRVYEVTVQFDTGVETPFRGEWYVYGGTSASIGPYELKRGDWVTIKPLNYPSTVEYLHHNYIILDDNTIDGWIDCKQLSIVHPPDSQYQTMEYICLYLQ